MLPLDETLRLKALRTHVRRPTGPEPLFTDIVALSALLFNVPISALVLVEADEVVYQATYGPVDLIDQSRVKAGYLLSIQQQALVVADLAQVGVSATAAKASSAKELRFYAGVPLALAGHDCLGVLCVLDQLPRLFSGPEQRLLEHLSHLAGRFLALRRHCLTSWTEAADYWRIMQEELRQEVRVLLALVRLRQESEGTTGAESSSLLEVVDQRLSALSWRLADYYPSL
jgi:GAF domain-containing protein